MRNTRLFFSPTMALLLTAMLPTLSNAGKTLGMQDLYTPLLGDVGVQDPSSAVLCNGKYYIYGSNGAAAVSTDRITWAGATGAPVNKQSWWKNGGVWAVDATYMDGMYYCYYSVSASNAFNSQIGVTASKSLDPKSADYKWVDQGQVLDSAMGSGGTGKVNVIDPSTFLDSDGKWYLCYGSFQNGVRMVELNRATGKTATNPPKVWKITDHTGEGSAMFRWGKYYYYAVSRGGCCAGVNSTYEILYGRATTATGIYYAKGGGSFQIYATGETESLLHGTNSPSSAKNVVVADGVGGFFYDHRGNGNIDTAFLSYMAYTATTGSPLLSIRPCYATSDGWLTMNPALGTVMTQPVTTALSGRASTTVPSSFHMAGDVLHMDLVGWTRADLEIFDLSGRKIGSSRLAVLEGKSNLDLRALAGSGIREIRVTGDGGQLAQRVFVN